MKRLIFAGRVALMLACVGWAAFLWTRPRPPVRPVGPQDYSAFAVELDGERIKIRNAGGEVLTGCEIEFTAELADGATYQGKRYFAQWELSEVQEIGISPPRGSANVPSVRFSGHVSSPDKGWRFWRLAFPADTGGE